MKEKAAVLVARRALPTFQEAALPETIGSTGTVLRLVTGEALRKVSAVVESGLVRGFFTNGVRK